MRTSVLAALFTLGASTAAFADASVAGNWHADLDSGVSIDMQVAPNGAWNSRTLQENQVVREMRGTYRQQHAGTDTGTLVFVPKHYTSKIGKVTTETDRYELGEAGKVLKLTSGGDTMVFEKREQR
nr:hypothetical protein [uncultured Rhodopila sp.]